MAWRTRTVVWILFLVNLGLAALASFPIYRDVLAFTGHSLMNQSLITGFSTDWLTDFSINNPGTLERLARLMALMGLFSISANTVLAGGVVARFRSPDERFSLGIFFRDTGRYAWRLLRLMVIGLVCYWIVFWVLNYRLRGFIDHRTRNSLHDRPVFWINLGVSILVLLGIGFVNLALDYARVKLVLEDGSSAIEAFLAALGFSLGRLRRAVTVYALPSLGGLALLGLYVHHAPRASFVAHWGATSGASYGEPLGLALIFIGQQLIMFGRYWFRVATWASEWSLYAGAHPGPTPIAHAGDVT